MPVSRRNFIHAGPAGMFAAVVMAASAGQAATTDLAVTCDVAAAPAVLAAGRAFRQKTGVRVRLFPTSPGLILPQLEREIQNDIIFTQVGLIDQAEQLGLVTPGGRAGPWRNRLVTVTTKQPGGPEGSFAVPDPSPASDFDGITVLHRLGLGAGKLMGVIDTGAVTWMLTRNEARRGIVHQTEVTEHTELSALMPVPDDAWPPILYAATVTKLAYRGDPGAFVAFLASPEGQAVLHAAGLESVA